LAPAGNEARYRVREQLAGVDLPNDAVGVTSANGMTKPRVMMVLSVEDAIKLEYDFSFVPSK